MIKMRYYNTPQIRGHYIYRTHFTGGGRVTAPAADSQLSIRERFAPGRLWSLLEVMQKLGIWDDVIASALDWRASADESSWPRAHASNAEGISFYTALGASLQKLKGLCDRFGLPISSGLIQEKLEGRLPQSFSEMEMLEAVVKKEIENCVFLFIPPHLAAFFQKEDILPEDARHSFPQANRELTIAGSCLSLGLSTASVFHSMRALEYGIGALAADTNVVFDIQTWHGVIDEIERAIKLEAKSLPKGTAKNERLQFLSEAAAEFRYFKDGWRNYVSHNKLEYDEPQARKVLEHTRDFTVVLSSQLSGQ